jgi:hypothetical protein
LAPAPATLNEDEDLAMADLASMVELEALSVIEDAPASELSQTVSNGNGVAIVALENTPSATDMAVAAALADVGALVAAQPVSLVLAGPGVPAATPRPLVRPEGRRVASLPVTNDGTGAIDPGSIPLGTRLVQLGAYGSEEVARAEWANAIANFGDYMVGKERIVQQAETGGRIFWRLRALGFADLSEARRFCAVLVSDGANCIPVVQE